MKSSACMSTLTNFFKVSQNFILQSTKTISATPSENKLSGTSLYNKAAFYLFMFMNCNYKKPDYDGEQKLTKVDTKTNRGMTIWSLLHVTIWQQLYYWTWKAFSRRSQSTRFSILHAPLPFECHTLQKIHIRERKLALRTKIIWYVALKHNAKFLACSFAY